MKNKILLIVEGEVDEKKFFKKIGKINKDFELEIFPFKTNLYELYKEIEKYDFDTDTITILQERKNSEKETIVLRNNFAYIYLIFDCDLQDNHYKNNLDILIKMVNYFDDPTENGKLLINYPMLESYRDIDLNNENDFLKRYVNVNELSKYKQIVNERGNPANINTYDWPLFLKLVKVNLLKITHLLQKKNKIIEYDEYLNKITQEKILSYQLGCIKEDYLYILNCGILILIDYFGEKLYNKLK